MQRINLYKSGNAVGPNPAEENQAVHGYRLVADEGMELTNREQKVLVIDIALEDLEAWTEQEMEDTEEIPWETAGRILAGEPERGESE